MTGIYEFKIVNSAIVPDIALPPPSLESCFVAKCEQGSFYVVGAHGEGETGTVERLAWAMCEAV